MYCVSKVPFNYKRKSIRQKKWPLMWYRNKYINKYENIWGWSRRIWKKKKIKTKTTGRPDYSRNIENVCWETEGCFKTSLTLQRPGKLRIPENEKKGIHIEANPRIWRQVLCYDNYNKDTDRKAIGNAPGRFIIYNCCESCSHYVTNYLRIRKLL